MYNKHSSVGRQIPHMGIIKWHFIRNSSNTTDTTIPLSINPLLFMKHAKNMLSSPFFNFYFFCFYFFGFHFFLCLFFGWYVMNIRNTPPLSDLFIVKTIFLNLKLPYHYIYFPFYCQYELTCTKLLIILFTV